ncbi:MAG: YitT family protein [Rikenellaceae bacterium]|jgi:uncharacterized membrane-anchored protein YitT (DUF2179 family)|nr:YitT family protein [Rikenellaceae bacterium]
MNYFREKLFSFAWWKQWIFILTGCVLLAAGFVLFMNPYKIVPGGVYGLGIVMHQLFPAIEVGTFGLMFDIPLLLIAFRFFGGRFGARTVVAAILTPVIMNIMTWTIGENPATMFGGKIDLTDDIIISCLFGGVLIGAGVGMIIKTRATSGGTDIVAMILTKLTRMTFSQGILIVDSAVVVFGIIVLGDWRLPLYSIVTIFVSSRVIDYVIDGASYDKLLFIISEKHDELRHFILDEMGRGGTYIKASGMYTGQGKEMMFVVVSRREVSTVQNKVRETDPEAFVVVVDAYETFGDGFKSFPES